MTVDFWPQNLKTWSIISETTFLGKSLSTNENLLLILLGRIFANKNLPAVLINFSNFILPFSSIVLNLETILEWTFICPISNACSISEVLTK